MIDDLFPSISNMRRVEQVPWENYPGLEDDEKPYFWYCRLCSGPMWVLGVMGLVEGEWAIGWSSHVMIHVDLDECNMLFLLTKGARM